MNKRDTHDFHPERIEPDQGRIPERMTSGGFLVRDGNVLMEKRPDDARVYPGVWDTPGGHVESNETPEETLIREMDEELGIKPTQFQLGAVLDDVDPGTGRFYRHFIYIIDAWEGEPASRENRTIQWFSVAEALQLDALNPLMGYALKDFVAKKWVRE